MSANSFEKFQRRRLLTSYFSVVLSITLVLFLIGILGLIVLNTKNITDYFKEKVVINIYVKNDVRDVEINHLQKKVLMQPYAKEVTFISKEVAAEELSKDIGETFLEFLGYNPLQNSISVKLKADYVTPLKVSNIKKEILRNTEVESVSYDEPLISLLNDNAKKVTLWILFISSIFAFIAIMLINASIRLSIYSKRFIIKTMQLVGAQKSFIRRPFISQSIKLGVIGALCANIILTICIYYLYSFMPSLHIINPVIIGEIYVMLIVISVMITWLSTYFAAQKFLNLRTDDLYD